MYSDVWLTKPEHGDIELLFMAGLSDTMALRIVGKNAVEHSQA